MLISHQFHQQNHQHQSVTTGKCVGKTADYEIGAIAVFGGEGSYKKCVVENGVVKWTDCPVDDAHPECRLANVTNAPVYLQEQQRQDQIEQYYEKEIAFQQQSNQGYITPDELDVITRQQQELNRIANSTKTGASTPEKEINSAISPTVQINQTGTQATNQYIQNLISDFFNNYIPGFSTYTNPNNYDSLRYQQLNISTQTQSTSLGFWDTIRNRLNNSNELQNLGQYGLGGGNAYVAPVPMSVATSQDRNAINNYMSGHLLAFGTGFTTAAITSTAPLAYSYAPEIITTIMNIKYVPHILTVADALDSTVTGIACNLGNQDACSYFQASLFIPGFTTPNMLVDTFDDFARVWRQPVQSLDNLSFAGSVMRLDDPNLGAWPDVNSNIIPDKNRVFATNPNTSDGFVQDVNPLTGAPIIRADTAPEMNFALSNPSLPVRQIDPSVEVARQEFRNAVVIEQDLFSTNPNIFDPAIRVRYQGQEFTANSIREAENIATQLTGSKFKIDPEKMHIEEPSALTQKFNDQNNIAEVILTDTQDVPSSMLFAPRENPVTNQGYLVDLFNRTVGDTVANVTASIPTNLNRLVDDIRIQATNAVSDIFSPTRPADTPTTPLTTRIGVWDGVRGWWQRNVGDLNFRGLQNDQAIIPRTTNTNNFIDSIIARFNGRAQPSLTNQEVPNITRLTPDEDIAVPADLLNNNVGQANPKFTETDSTILQDLPPRKPTKTVFQDAIDSSLPTATKTGGDISPALPLVGVFALGLTDYIAEEIFGINLLDFSQNTQTKSIGVKLNEILLPTLDIANEPEKNSQNQNISYNPSAQNESAIAPVFSTQSNSEFSDVLIYTSDGPRPFRLIGCGPTAVSNILNQLGLAGMSPLQIAQMVDTQDWGYYGTNVLQDSSLIKILRQYGINPVKYTNSLQFSLANDTNTGDILLVGAKFRYNGGTIDHISYMQIQSDGRIKLMDNFMITDAYCTPTDNSTLSCKNSKGESLTIDVTNMPIYLIDNTQKAVIPQIPLDRKTTVTGGGTTNISYADQNSAITNGFIYFNQKDPQWQDLPTYGDTTVANKGCGIMTGAMVTGTNPEVYYEAYRRYQQSQGNVDLLTNSGTNFNVHMAVLKDIGCDTIPIAGSFEEIKDQVEKYTDSGTPVWVNAEIYGYGHNAMATGVDENGNLILNDPWRSENTAVEDRYIKDRPETPWRFSAVVCEN